jgi:hypothetical protein
MNAITEIKPRAFKAVSGLDHPTPTHIRGCIFDRITAEMAARREFCPLWISQAIRDGIAQACAEHDQQVTP